MGAAEIALALAQFAPSLLRYFGVGEKSAAVADKVIELAKQVTGTPSGPEAIEALRQNAQLAHEFNLAALKMDGDLETAYLADRKDARARDVALHQAGFNNKRADWMIAMDVIGLIACLAVLTFFRKEIPAEVVGLITTIATAFALCLRDAHQFEFGSSRGSRDKAAQLAGLAEIKKTL